MSAANDFNSNDGVINVRDITMQNKIMACLLCRVATETSVASNIGQCSGDGIATDFNSCLEVCNDLAKQVKGCRNVGVNRQPD